MDDTSLDLLYLEDDPLAIRLLVEACQVSRHPVRVHTVQDREAAVSALSDENTNSSDGAFDLLLVSLELTPPPEPSALEQIRDVISLQSLPVILFSNADVTDEIPETIKAEVDAVVQKPPNFDELVQFVETLVEVHQSTESTESTLRPDYRQLQPERV